MHCDAKRPVAYFSAILDLVAVVLPGCLKAVAAVGVSIQQSSNIVMGYPLNVLVPHAVEILLTKTHTQYLTHSRLTC